MCRIGSVAAVRWAVLSLAAALAAVAPAAAQTFETVGTRAAGMGGAFVAVADDASAVYWNPAGLALGGSFFSLIIDGGLTEAEPDAEPQAGSHSSTLIGFSTPPLGVSYYRLGATALTPVTTAFTGSPVIRAERLTTHHVGVTLVQSLTSRVAVATTLKLVQGSAASAVVIHGDREDLLDGAGDFPTESTSRFDADIGVMAAFGQFRAGLTLRNVTEPDFDTPAGGELELKRQTRAGLAYFGLPGIVAAADIDIERARGSLGDVRNLAGGLEARLMPRAFVRGGFRFNTLGDEPGGHAPVYSVGGSYAVLASVFVDGQVTLGSEAGDRGWSIAARLVY
jgi:F plasmid transfer operon, TraF, protein